MAATRRRTAQNANGLLGKILRIDPSTDAFPADAARDYSIPPTNPFAGGGGLPEILAMGLRNPFRISVDRVTGRHSSSAMSARTPSRRSTGFAANPAGITNYGWNLREGSQPNNGGADSPSFTLPVTEYGTGGGLTQGNSITGGVVYRGPIDDLQGQYIFADFIATTTGRFRSRAWSSVQRAAGRRASPPQHRLHARRGHRVNSIVAFGTDNDGNVYIVDIGGEVFGSSRWALALRRLRLRCRRPWRRP